jgi:hypothetical protein
MTDRFLRSRRLRDLLWLAADGKCQLCGRELPDDWHADHITPYSVAGETNVFDMQALCPRCNLEKGDRMVLCDKVSRAQKLCDQIAHFGSALRSHQLETVRMLRGIAVGMGGGDWPYMTSPGFLVEEIVPGGGKSPAAVMCASVLVGSGLFDVAFWISPRLTLIQQALEDFSNTGIAMQKFGKPIPIFNPARLMPQEVPDNHQKLLDPDSKVWVLPYQRLNSVAYMLAMLAERKNVLLIFDEFQLLRDLDPKRHDAQIDGPDGWYRLIEPLVLSCQRKMGFGGVILSGGLFRNDGRRLPCVNYRQGDIARGEDPKKVYPLSDIRYTLSEAQADGCIIKMDTDFYDGEVSFRLGDSPDSVQNVADMTEQAYNHKLAFYLEQEDVWKTIIGDMLESLDGYNPPGYGYRARYMVTSKSIADAEIHTKHLYKIGRKPLLIHSKLSEAEIKRLDEFRRGQGPWDGLVSVAMGYIGLSIADLSHMAYLSDYRSAAWWNQAAHRITRTDYNPRAPAYRNQLARFFLPNDPKMQELAQQLMADQNPGVAAMPRPGPPKICGPGWPPKQEFEGLSASISGRQFNTNGEQCTEHDFIDRAVRELPQLNSLPRLVVEEFKKFSDRYGKTGEE